MRLTTVLGVAAAVLVVAVGVLVTLTVLDRDDATQQAEPQATVTVTSVQTRTPPPATTPSPVVTTPRVPSPVIAEGAPCSPSQVRSFGTDASGRSLVCGYSGTATPRWHQHGRLGPGVHEAGEPCDSSVDQVGRDSNGLFVMCGGTVWVTNP